MDKKTEKLFPALFFLLMSGVSMVGANEHTATCAAAVGPVNYSDATLPVDVKALIDSYRSDWRTFCGSGPSRPSLADLYKKAEDVEQAIVSASVGPDFVRNESLEALLCDRYARFLPAFLDSLGERRRFSASKREFRIHAHLGTDEDRTFFNTALGSDDDFPWLKIFENDVACIKYGQFDWMKAIKEVIYLRDKLKSQAYVRDLRLYQGALLHSPGAWSEFPERMLSFIVTCGDKDDVLKDLKKIRDILKSEPMFAEDFSNTQKTIELIETGQITVRSAVN